jgi:hypothetical protein
VLCLAIRHALAAAGLHDSDIAEDAARFEASGALDASAIERLNGLVIQFDEEGYALRDQEDDGRLPLCSRRSSFNRALSVATLAFAAFGDWNAALYDA